MLYNLLNFLLFGFLFADLLERKYPDELNKIIMTSSYNVIYIYSKAQICMIKIYNNITYFIDNNQSLFKIKTYFIEIINSNNVTKQIDFYKNGDKSNENDYDLAISSSYDSNSKCSLKKIMNKNTITDFNNFEIAEIKFILLELCIGNEFSKKYNTYKINLKTNNYNFYIVNNIFSKDFFTYYMKNIHEPKIDLNDIEFAKTKILIKILDHNVNSVFFDITDNKEEFIIKKNIYESNIINYAKSK